MLISIWKGLELIELIQSIMSLISLSGIKVIPKNKKPSKNNVLLGLSAPPLGLEPRTVTPYNPTI